MKTFLQHAKELEREELERQMNRHFEMAQKSLDTAHQLEMAGDMDGYKTFMAKHHHFQTQGDYLKNALNESFANDFLAMAKKRVPSAEIKSSEQRRKETDALMKQRQAAAANRPKQSSGGAGEKYPLGGYDAKSGRSYSEEVENVVEMDKTQTPPGRDGDIDWTKKQIHLGPERMMKAKDVAKHALKALDKTMKKSTPEKKGVAEEVELDEVAAWQRKEGKNPSGGLNKKGIASYRRENPGSKLSMAVTTKPSKLKKGSKSWNRRKSFCARMGGMPGPMKDEKGRPTRKALSLRKWNC